MKKLISMREVDNLTGEVSSWSSKYYEGVSPFDAVERMSIAKNFLINILIRNRIVRNEVARVRAEHQSPYQVTEIKMGRP